MQAIVAANRMSRTYSAIILLCSLAPYWFQYAIRPRRRPTALGGDLVPVEADNAAGGDDCGHQLGGSDVEGGVGRIDGGLGREYDEGDPVVTGAQSQRGGADLVGRAVCLGFRAVNSLSTRMSCRRTARRSANPPAW